MDSFVSVAYNHASDVEVKRFVLACEETFLHQVDEAADRIIMSGKRFVSLTGPSCSGKTTASARICHELALRGIRVKTVSLDDFFLPRAYLLKCAEEQGVSVDFDSPDTIDTEYFALCVDKLRRGETALLPYYDFQEGCCTKKTPFSGKDADIFLFEGIQTCFPRVREILKREDTLTVFIRPSDGISACDVRLSANELRFARRVVRDSRSRGMAPAFTYLLWKGARANERLYMEPYEPTVDFHINSTLLYEPAMIRDMLLGKLAEIPDDSPYKSEAERLAALFGRIPQYPTHPIPADSIFREFIGEET